MMPTHFTMASSIVTCQTFEPSSLCFGPVEKNSLGGRFIPIVDKNGNKTKIMLQYPAMHLPFGISEYRDKPDGKAVSYSVDLSFRGYESKESVLMLFNKLNELDNHLIDVAYANSIAWFGKQKSRELLEDTYRRLTRADPSGKYAPMTKAKIALSRASGKPDVQVFDTDKTPITIPDVPRGSTVKILAELASVWFVGSTSWGVTFRAIQILVTDKPAKTSGFAFVPEDDDEDVSKTDVCMFDSE
jgi:hypothetical protein